MDRVIQFNGFSKAVNRFTVKDYKEVLRILIGLEEKNTENIYIISKELWRFFSEYLHDSCIVNKIDLYDLGVLVLALRGIFFGDRIKLKINSTAFTLDVFEAIKKLQTNQQALEKGIGKNPTIFFKAPKAAIMFNRSIDEIALFEKEVSTRNFLELGPLFWEKIQYEKVKQKFTFESIIDCFERAAKIYANTKPTIVLEEQAHLEAWFKTTLQNNLFPTFEGIDSLYYFPLPSHFASLTKICFSENLEDVYSDMFHLARIAHISCEYIDSCEPGEFFLFISFLRKILTQQKEENGENLIDFDSKL